MRFFCFHLMPWAYLPEDFAQRYDSAWVTCPTSLYDAELGHPLYNRYLDELELADRLGSVGNAPSELTRRSMTLFAQEIMPKLRPINTDTPLVSPA